MLSPGLARPFHKYCRKAKVYANLGPCRLLSKLNHSLRKRPESKPWSWEHEEKPNTLCKRVLKWQSHASYQQDSTFSRTSYKEFDRTSPCFLVSASVRATRREPLLQTVPLDQLHVQYWKFLPKLQDWKFLPNLLIHATRMMVLAHNVLILNVVHECNPVASLC